MIMTMMRILTTKMNKEDDYDDFDDEYRKGSGLKKFFIGALIVILVVAVTALQLCAKRQL